MSNKYTNENKKRDVNRTNTRREKKKGQKKVIKKIAGKKQIMK
jgi:hypothetical protein